MSRIRGSFVLLVSVLATWTSVAAAEGEEAPDAGIATETTKPVAPRPAAPTAVTPAEPPVAPPTSLSTEIPSLKLENGSVSLKVGVLVQPQFQMLGSTTLHAAELDLYVRRARLIVGGTLLDTVDYFFETDYPNLFYGRTASGTQAVKIAPVMNIQDVFLTLRPFGSTIKLDAGYFLPPMSHNAVQGAGTLYGWDYYAYTFQHSSLNGYGGTLLPFGTSDNVFGRDAGAQLRGLLFGEHLEYRLGVFQGLRNAATTTQVGARNLFRAAGRLQLNFLDAETGFFYQGTYLGAKKILSVGAAYDFQNSLSDDYVYYALDALLNLPLGPGVLTAQINYVHFDGHAFTVGTPLERQNAVMGEAGFTIFALRLSPIVRFEHTQGPNLPPQSRYGGGLAFWHKGHNSNLKAFYTRIVQGQMPPLPPFHDANQLNLQWQLYFF